ncbi:MAG: hypothetical protein ACRDPS_08740 [Nocardioides sp.]|uniref:hypothetical protein n=1 Tax=Nocardioides sp. TaxID=35761 RepID=UPI003D6AE96C
MARKQTAILSVTRGVTTLNGLVVERPWGEDPHQAGVRAVREQFAGPSRRPVEVVATDDEARIRMVVHPDGLITDVETLEVFGRHSSPDAVPGAAWLPADAVAPLVLEAEPDEPEEEPWVPPVLAVPAPMVEPEPAPPPPPAPAPAPESGAEPAPAPPSEPESEQTVEAAPVPAPPSEPEAESPAEAAPAPAQVPPPEPQPEPDPEPEPGPGFEPEPEKDPGPALPPVPVPTSASAPQPEAEQVPDRPAGPLVPVHHMDPGPYRRSRMTRRGRVALVVVGVVLLIVLYEIVRGLVTGAGPDSSDKQDPQSQESAPSAPASDDVIEPTKEASPSAPASSAPVEPKPTSTPKPSKKPTADPGPTRTLSVDATAMTEAIGLRIDASRLPVTATIAMDPWGAPERFTRTVTITEPNQRVVIKPVASGHAKWSVKVAGATKVTGYTHSWPEGDREFIKR